jgi:DUF1680 family protein
MIKFSRPCAFIVVLLWLPALAMAVEAAAERGALVLDSPPQTTAFRLAGFVGQRVDADERAWLLPAPEANPGLVAMFARRDHLPPDSMVPWAGEFAGKYLISCVNSIRLSGNLTLRDQTSRVVTALIATQDSHGYLGPFPSSRRWLTEWDLWGHYHVMQGLLGWYDLTGDKTAWTAVLRAADGICGRFCDGQLRVFDAGSHEMNMAIAHVLGDLHLRTGNPRYIQLVRQIETDWERSGDYLRTGLAEVPFFRTPNPRWESLHDLQALVSLWRITGDERYRTAVRNHWRSIRDKDLRITGGFSGGEKATGKPFAPDVIETCGTIGWMALSLDLLRLDGDPQVADLLELATFNAVLGAQHPSGRWWTYNTPMDGVRTSCLSDLAFQARPGTPDLTCCSTNGPRGLGMLADWMVMRDKQDGLVLNWFSPFSVTVPTTSGMAVNIQCESTYPAGGNIRYRVTSPKPVRLRVRIPGWAEMAVMNIGNANITCKSGTYAEVPTSVWKAGTIEIVLSLPLTVRSRTGAEECLGRFCLMRGPLLLAFDQRDNELSPYSCPSLDPNAITKVLRSDETVLSGSIISLSAATARGTVRLRDFASAGMSGGRYRTWLPTQSATPSSTIPLLAARLRDHARPIVGELHEATSFAGGNQGLTLNGIDQRLVYRLPQGFWQGDYTLMLAVRQNQPCRFPLGQIICAWCAPYDDPLRIVIDKNQLYVRVEGNPGGEFGSVPFPSGAWRKLVAVKQGDGLTVFLDGKIIASGGVGLSASRSSLVGIGGNPLFRGDPEFAPITVRDLQVYGRALTDAEINRLPTSTQGP